MAEEWGATHPDQADLTSAVGEKTGNQRSRPSKTNCTSTDSASLPAEESSWRSYWWKEKNPIVDRFVDEMPGRAARPVSVRGGTTLREDCVAEKHNGGHRSQSWSSILNEFLKWYNGYRHAHLIFKDPDGKRVRGQMTNAHQPRYGDRYYARLKALERQMIREYDNPHVVMLTFTGSTRNANGGWRCPCDHMRDVVESWRPDRGRGVYHALSDALRGKSWEYATVVEKHKSGYGHVHCAVFIDGEVTEDDFHPVIDAHLRQCEIAHRDAHDYYAEDEKTRPISVREINTELSNQESIWNDPAVDPNNGDLEQVLNLGSYVGEYIGAHGEALFDRGLGELVFRAAAWATGTQMVRFSNGANEMIERERVDEEPRKSDPSIEVKEEFDPEADNPSETIGGGAPVKVKNANWSIEGVGRVKEDGEELYEIRRSDVSYVKIEGSQHLDPPNHQPVDPPQPTLYHSKIQDY